MEITRDKRLSRRDRLIVSKAVETKPIRTKGTSSQETGKTVVGMEVTLLWVEGWMVTRR